MIRISIFKSLILLFFVILSCSPMVGPNYTRPEADIEKNWRIDNKIITTQEYIDYSQWWKLFNDPILNDLIDKAYKQNLTLIMAGLRVIQAQAARGIAIGGLFPQEQSLSGSYTKNNLSKNTTNEGSTIDINNFSNYQAGFDVVWELDFWGKFRRAVESANAELLASVASYDDVLVSLIAEVAATYVKIRTFENRLIVANRNVDIQENSLNIANAKYRNGLVSLLDVTQAKSLLNDTKSTIPILRSEIINAKNNLCVLLGTHPKNIDAILAGSSEIPSPNAQIVIGIPAELIRRRPDIRESERELAAQSARIGIAESDLYPQFTITGSIGFRSDDFTDLFNGSSLTGLISPGFQWPIFNYGRIRNNIRVQDALFQQLAENYENTVLKAQEEVENSITNFIEIKKRVIYLEKAVVASNQSVKLSHIQYVDGDINYTRLLDSQQFLVNQENLLVESIGLVSLNLISLYKALGGGWEIREGKAFIPDIVKKEMENRTNWGNLLKSEKENTSIEDAAAYPAMDGYLWWRGAPQF